mmetsp:Transcript_22246/g.56574  ORF Transcript_22246/g.56574 Transcript_22246/m.56574 type:complete len:231 (-) Transcript_22246:801-1493(-)
MSQQHPFAPAMPHTCQAPCILQVATKTPTRVACSTHGPPLLPLPLQHPRCPALPRPPTPKRGARAAQPRPPLPRPRGPAGRPCSRPPRRACTRPPPLRPRPPPTPPRALVRSPALAAWTRQAGWVAAPRSREWCWVQAAGAAAVQVLLALLPLRLPPASPLSLQEQLHAGGRAPGAGHPASPPWAPACRQPARCQHSAADARLHPAAGQLPPCARPVSAPGLTWLQRGRP